MVVGLNTQWPGEAEKEYQRIRILGSGAFSAVWLAKSRKSTHCTCRTPEGNENGNNVSSTAVAADGKTCRNVSGGCRCGLVAMKVTSITSRENPANAFKWAEREIEILRELDHPQIVKIVREFHESGGNVGGGSGDTNGEGGKSSNSSEKNNNNEDDNNNPKDDDKSHSISIVNTPESVCVALSVALGPTLQDLVEYGGALGLPLARLVSKQLISAVAYMHGRAVIHRDIKPDNIIVDGATLEDASCWSDHDPKDNEMENDDGRKDDSSDILDKRRHGNSDGRKEGGGSSNPNRCKRTWHVILIDFGFAKALTPEDISGDIGLYRTINEGEKIDGSEVLVSVQEQSPHPPGVSLDLALVEEDSGWGSVHGKDKSFRRKRKDMDESVSNKKLLDMSAVGNVHYAAPEIFRTLRPAGAAHAGGSKCGDQARGSYKKSPLSEKVADYGMIADAFSIGATLRYIMTGVPPQYDVQDYIGFHNTPVALAVGFLADLCANVRFSFSKKKTTYSLPSSQDNGNETYGNFGVKSLKKRSRRKLRYRTNDRIPRDAAHLIRALTLLDEKKRCTVRAAQTYAWVTTAGLSEESSIEKEGKRSSLTGAPVEFLPCVTQT